VNLADARLRLALQVAAVVVVFDQLTKLLVVATIPLYHQIDLAPFFALTYVRNRGAAFSALADAPASVRVPLFLVVTIIAVGVLLSYLRDTPPERRGLIVAFGAILGGAVGNLICRVRAGEVIDFLLLHWDDWQWPVFNVADSAISVGVAVLLLSSFRGGSRVDFTRPLPADTSDDGSHR
jgi:signal peptidase II